MAAAATARRARSREGSPPSTRGRFRVRAAARALAAAPGARRPGGGRARARARRPLPRRTAAVAQALADPDPELPYGWRADLYDEASSAGLAEVASLLVAPPPARVYREPRDKADPRLAHLTLGHKKALARARRDPDLIARLAAEGEPAVVDELLRNPWLTEELRGPHRGAPPLPPGTLRRLFESPRWRARPAVARAPRAEPLRGDRGRPEARPVARSRPTSPTSPTTARSTRSSVRSRRGSSR